MSVVAAGGAAPNPNQSQDATPDAPQMQAGEQAAQKKGLDVRLQKALMEVKSIFKMRYQPKRLRFISESMRAFDAFRGNTYALLNDQAAALDTINQLMQGFLGQGDDPQLYAHNDNIYQMFGMSFIAALMVEPGKVRYQPADASDESYEEIAKKASKIQAFNERKNDIKSLQQLELLYLWLTGSYWTYVRYIIDKDRAGTSPVPIIEMQTVKAMPDGYLCRSCGKFIPDGKATMFSSKPMCPNCGAQINQKDWFEGPEIEVPVQVGTNDVANGMTAFDIVCGLMIDANPDAAKPSETEILDYTVDISAAKVRSSYPTMYTQITASMGSDSGSDGDMARTARAGMTTPGSNSYALTTEGLVSYSRCWITPEAFYELEDQTVADELKAEFPKGCKLVTCGAETFLDVKPESLTEHWTWCGTVKGLGLYPFAAGKVCLDVQERVTGAVNKIDAYMDRVAYGTMLYDADYIDGNAMSNKVLTPGNLTPVSRTDEETGASKPLSDLMFQPSFHIDSEIYKYVDTLTTRAQLLCGVMPQIFGGSDKNVQTAKGQEQALNTALGRLKQYIDQMNGEKAARARISVKCSIENMDEEIKIVEEGETSGSWQTVRILKAELTGDFFTFPEDEEGFPATFNEIQARMMQLLAENQKMPFVSALLSDPDVAATMGYYILPPEIELPNEAQRAKIKSVLRALAEDKNGPITRPPVQPGGPPVVVPSIMPEPNVDDPAMCQQLAKKWLLKNWQQEQTNPRGYGNVLAYLKIAAFMAKEQAAEATLTLASQHAQGQQGGAGQGTPQAS